MRLETVKNTYSQDADSCDAQSGGFQQLTIETEDAGCGGFIVISTERWALDLLSIDAFCAELKRVAAMNRIPPASRDADEARQPKKETTK